MRSSPLVVALSIVLLLPGAAAAQQSPSDPEPNSPSGVVYELPFDRGREDAAPRKPDSRDLRDDHDGDRERSSIRSENNFGSSSIVPGVDDGEDVAPSSGGSSDGGGEGGPGASGGKGAGGSAGGESGAGGPPALTAVSAADEPSDSAVVLVLTLILVVGIAVGLLSSRAWRRRAGT